MKEGYFRFEKIIALHHIWPNEGELLKIKIIFYE